MGLMYRVGIPIVRAFLRRSFAIPKTKPLTSGTIVPAKKTHTAGVYRGCRWKGDRAMVLIEGMDKPKSCYECPLVNVDEDCGLRPESSGDETLTEQYANCPLKEVQE